MKNIISQQPNTTPMMQQYFLIKEAHKDYLLFYRMGDFYEMFFGDAVIASEVLDIALTSRGKIEEEKIPMCGVPYHSYENYLHKLIKAGYKVAICEQLESPEEAKKRGYKAVVKRDVVRIVTPGTLIEDALLDSRESNYLCAISKFDKDIAISWIELSTGEFYTASSNFVTLPADLARLNPKEILLPDEVFIDSNFKSCKEEYNKQLSPKANNFFDFMRAQNRLKSLYNLSSLDVLHEFTKSEIAAAGTLIEYVNLTQKGNLPKISLPKKFINSNFMSIDAATRRNLELVRTLSGDKKNSLIDVIDLTITSNGARLLAQFISSPLAHSSGINNRLKAVKFFVENNDLRQKICVNLQHIDDIERALTRITMGKASPRDILVIKNGLKAATNMAKILSNVENMPQLITQIYNAINIDISLAEELQLAFKDEVGFYAKDGNFIRENYNARLDELNDLKINGRTKINDLRDKYREITGVNSLKIAHNNMLGYYIEVTSGNIDKMSGIQFIHRQGLAGAARYTSEELRRLENDIVSAADEALNLELAIFNDFINKIISKSEEIAITAQNISFLDVFSALARLADEQNYVMPIVTDGSEFVIEDGRHPVIEQVIKKRKENFTANDCNLSKSQNLWLITGPNMAGKSTFLRQNAIITIMAQIGSYVPAKQAYIGTIDKLFSRVGASDDLAKGHSTFMVEMIETATILNQAGQKSLVILDEIGRGTATYDGLAIAWAVIENLHNNNKCRTLFATHYHELTALANNLDNMQCYTVKVQEWQKNIIFMHKLIQGTADKSYGIYVAKLAGVPQKVIERAEIILQSLEDNSPHNINSKLPLFSNTPSNVNQPVNENKPSLIEDMLAKQNLDELSPRDALDILYKLKSMIN